MMMSNTMNVSECIPLKVCFLSWDVTAFHSHFGFLEIGEFSAEANTICLVENARL